jgi:hypothetical protein
VPDLDDGVMVNAAALWPLLAPQWKDPKKWWKELAAADGKKDYDWSHLAMRYWPRRVDAKCEKDPSLAVAHGCFFKYHPARAWAWELRLQDEIGPAFRIEEEPYRGDGGHEAHRTAFLADHPVDALAASRRRRCGGSGSTSGGSASWSSSRRGCGASGPTCAGRSSCGCSRSRSRTLSCARPTSRHGPGCVRAQAPRAGEEAA